MNKIILDQLNKVSVTKLTYNEGDTEIFIPKTIKVLNSSLNKGEYYIIKLFDNITNPSENSVLASNWNGGKIPKHDTYIIEVLDNIGNMIKINGVANEDPSDNFFGYIPTDGFEVIKKL